MTGNDLAIGLVEDNPGDARLIQEMLREPPVAPYRIQCLSRLSDVLERVGREPFDVLLLDLGLPDSQGLATFERVNQQAPTMPIIIFSGAIDERLAVEAVARGAQDYLVKGQIDSVGLKRAIRYAIERKRAEQTLLQRERALQDSEDRTSFALAAAGMGVWELEFATNRLSWSETMAPVFGLAPEQAPKTTGELFQLIHPDDRRELEASFGRAIAGETAYQLEFRTIWPDGSTHWVAGLAKASHGADGRSRGLIGVGIDIDGRKSAEAVLLSTEDQLRQAQKMEAVGRLAGGVAHDFNNLLTVILGYCELMLDDLHQGDRHHADIVEIHKAGTRAGGLTRQLLAFSRKQIIEPMLLDLNAIASDMRVMVSRLIGEDVRVVLSLRTDLARVLVDRGQVEQVVMNLAVNARDAMPGGGTLTLETANVELDESYARTHLNVLPGPYVMLTVSDTGTGMTPEVQARLFEPFFTTKEPGKGTGLGMATVYGIVRRSGGSIDVYSEVGRGTSFKIYFPRAKGAEIVVEPPATVARPIGTQTILVVEDEDGLRELAKRLLTRQGYTVLVAAHADEALGLFEANPSIDVLLTDVVMPGASGPELTKRLIERRPGLKVVYMSGYTEDAIVHHGVLKAGIAFLNKPFTSETLGNKIREVLER
jgi:two-component system cell cycle sensor histidine kinase/response regulator CckA